MWMIFSLETDCTTLFSQSPNSGFSNDFPSHDEDVRTEGLLSEPLPVSLGVLQGCVMGPGTFYPWPSSNVAITPGISPMSNLIFLMQFRLFKDKRPRAFIKKIMFIRLHQSDSSETVTLTQVDRHRNSHHCTFMC